MKKTIILLSLLLSGVFVKAQILNFQFQFYNTGGTLLANSPTNVFDYSSTHSPFQVMTVDLSATVCEGQTIQMKNLTNGAYNSPVENITSATTYDAGWGVYYQENCYNNANWAANQILVSNQTWYQSSKNITIPYSPTTYPTIPNCYLSANYTFPSPWMAQLPPSDPCTYKYMLFCPKLQAGFTGLTGGINTGCNRGLGIRIKVKKGPKPLTIADVCSGSTATVNVPVGTTASNWVPSNPAVTPVTTPGNYSVTLSVPASGCSMTQTLTINGLGTDLAPSISGATTICNSSQSIFFGADASGYAYEAKWEIFQSNWMGTQGALVHSTIMDGAYLNTNFTFPSTLGQGYFILKYTVHGYNEFGCELTKVVTKTIVIAPWLLASYDGETNICAGSSTTLCAAVSQGYSVKWSFTGIRSSNVTTPCVTITPSVSTTGTVTITNTQYGCVSTATVAISVMANNANLTVNSTVTSGTITAVSVSPAYVAAPGYQSYYVVEKITGLGGTTIAGTQTPNTYTAAPSCWKDITTPITLTGYNGTSTVTCANPSVWGTGHYRITRYTKNNNCDWTSKSVDIGGSGQRLAHFASSEENENNDVIGKIYEDLNIIAFPNPTSGLVKIESKETVKSIHITTITGALVKNVQNETEVDLNNYPSGMYFFTILTENGKQTIKVIKE